MTADWTASALVCGAVIGAFIIIANAARRFAWPPALGPVVVTALLAGLALAVTGTPVARFQMLSAPLHDVLGPAIVALGGGVHAHRRALAAAARPLALAIAVGALTGIASAVALARLLGLGPVLVAATATRTVSTPFAILIQGRVGGPVSLAAGIAVSTGAIGAVLLPPLLRRIGIRDAAALGTATGAAAHLVGTAAIGRDDPVAATFAGAALVGVGILVALVMPSLWPWLIG